MPDVDPIVLASPSRLAVLHRLDLLDSPTEAAFDRLTKLASKIVNAPISLMSIVGTDRHVFKSFFGLPEPVTSRDLPMKYSVCSHVVATNEPLVVDDLRAHPLLFDNPIIQDLNVLAYVGVPITLQDGSCLGSFCAVDNHPREWTPAEIEIVQELANSVIVELELRSQLLAQQEAEAKIQAQNEELVYTNQELAIARKQAEAANQFKDQFLATMSHELRTPLNAVIGYSQLMVEGMVGTMNKEQMEFQERILINSRYLLDLINEVLDLSKIETGRQVLADEQFDLRACLQTVVDQSRVLADEKKLEFTFSIEDDLPALVVGDETRIRQIALNLLSNAIKFTDAGSVRVTVTRPDADHWQLTVRDTGIGIPSHLQDVIFDEFRQTKEGVRRGGTGLGLAIVRKLVLIMGGTIRLDSHVDEGSTFVVTLPLVTEMPVSGTGPLNPLTLADATASTHD